jgi:hypothetical protein
VLEKLNYSGNYCYKIESFPYLGIIKISWRDIIYDIHELV